jgi:putative ABC transport system ATP-binding protein
MLLGRLAHELGKTVLMVTHDPTAASYADCVYVLKDGLVVGTIEGGTRQCGTGANRIRNWFAKPGRTPPPWPPSPWGGGGGVGDVRTGQFGWP